MDHPAEGATTTAMAPLDPADASTDPSEPNVAALGTIRLQAEEHPLIGDLPPTSATEHCLHLMHLKSYEVAAAMASGCDVLDVGCNTGYGTLGFVHVGGRVVGVDVSPTAIEAARAAAVDGRPEFLTTDGLSLPFPDASFGLVVAFQVLEHIDDPLPYLRELARVSAPGGIIVLTTPNAATRLYPGMTPWNRFHVREYRADELEGLLRSVFPQVRIRGMFGTATLYETEIGRVDGARRRVRRNEAAKRAAAAAVARAAAARRRPLPVRMARAALPAGARAWLRSVTRSGSHAGRSLTPAPPPATPAPPPANPEPAMDLETFLRFSVADLFYAETDLERAMDLMAVCRLD
jgi:SAM-dependent methyltransferase